MDFSTLPVKWLKSHGDDSRELESVKMRQFPIIWRSRVQLIHRLLSEQFPTINGSLVFFFNGAVYLSASGGAFIPSGTQLFFF